MRNDQPFQAINYNTDQFIDPHTGLTVHDDGSLFYLQPDTEITYLKTRTLNGFFPDHYTSFQIALLSLGVVPANAYLTGDGFTPYVAEDGITPYITES